MKPPQTPFDLAVVGAGAAGIAAAIEGASLGMRTVLLERGVPGGAADSLVRIETVAGYPVGLTGAELTARAMAKAQRVGVHIETHDEVTALAEDDRAHRIERASGDRVVARFVVAATGADRLLPQIDGIRALLGAGIFTALPADLPATLRGRDAVVFGSGPDAANAAARLGAICHRVTVVTSGGGAAAPRGGANISLLRSTEIVCVAGVDRLESVVLRHTRNGRVSAIEAAALFLLSAASPRTSWLPPSVERDARGFVVTGLSFETSVPRLFAAGDVRSGSAGGIDAIADAICTVHNISIRP